MWLPTKQRVFLHVADEIRQPLWQVTHQFGGSFWKSTWRLEHWLVGFAFEDTKTGTKENNTGVFPLCVSQGCFSFCGSVSRHGTRKCVVVEMRKLLCSLILLLSFEPSGNKSWPLKWNLSPNWRTFQNYIKQPGYDFGLFAIVSTPKKSLQMR